MHNVTRTQFLYGVTTILTDLMYASNKTVDVRIYLLHLAFFIAALFLFILHSK